MPYAIVQEGVIMGLGASELAAEQDAADLMLSGGLYHLYSPAICVHASEEALRDWEEHGPDASIYITEAGEVKSRREASNDAVGELWVVLVDGEQRPQDPSFLVSSEDAEKRAIRMWKRHTGLRTLHPGRLSAVPKARLDADRDREILAVPADLSMRSCKGWIARIRLCSYHYAAGSAERRAYLAKAQRSVVDAAFVELNSNSKATSRYLNQEAEKFPGLVDSPGEPA